jgi:hypothetical protein
LGLFCLYITSCSIYLGVRLSDAYYSKAKNSDVCRRRVGGKSTMYHNLFIYHIKQHPSQTSSVRTDDISELSSMIQGHQNSYIHASEVGSYYQFVDCFC